MYSLLESSCIPKDVSSLETISAILADDGAERKVPGLLVYSLLANTLFHSCLETPWASFRSAHGMGVNSEDAKVLQGLHNRIASGKFSSCVTWGRNVKLKLIGCSRQVRRERLARTVASTAGPAARRN